MSSDNRFYYRTIFVDNILSNYTYILLEIFKPILHIIKRRDIFFIKIIKKII
ncbi:hypothetical protein LM701067_140594 [Listeria monocytogenes]|nr:hypothetical protein LM701067_140594 [Listeria monocytogenes]